MKKTLAGGIVALSFIALVAGNAAPSTALTVGEIQAQIQQVFSQLMALQPVGNPSTASSAMRFERPRVCDTLSRSLAVGARGDDVASLQEFLGSEGYFSAQATGYFGPLTFNSLKRWQASQGVSAVGIAGPMTRARIMQRCGGGGTICTKEYMPVCGAKPIVCITTPCNPIPQTYGNRCEMNADGAAYLYEGVCRSDSGNRPPTISSFSGPTTLAVNVAGTWTIQASDPENGSLRYSVTWGDEYRNFPPYASVAAQESFVQTTTFTHAYAASGTYTVTIIVRDASGLEARTSATVRVGSEPTFCTMQYDPVCGQPPEPACRHSIPACMMPDFPPQTYGNRCVLNNAGATFLYNGECRNGYACTADARQCPDGSWVGRTGPNCQFVCP